MHLWIIIFIVSYVISIGIILVAHIFSSEYELPDERYKRLIIFFPISSTFVSILILWWLIKDYCKENDIFEDIGDFFGDIFDWIDEKTFGKIKKHYQKKKERKRLLKIREEKIKLGIIKISEDDPYGEEDWDY